MVSKDPSTEAEDALKKGCKRRRLVHAQVPEERATSTETPSIEVPSMHLFPAQEDLVQEMQKQSSKRTLSAPPSANLMLEVNSPSGGSPALVPLSTITTLYASSLYPTTPPVLAINITTINQDRYWKLRASDFLSLSIHTHPNSPPSFTTQRGRSVSLIETVGRVVNVQHTDETLTIHIYDGSDSIPCILFLQPHAEHDDDPVVSLDIARRQAASVDSEKLVKVRGKIALSPDGALQLIGCSVTVKHGPNVEVLHIQNLSDASIVWRGMQVWRVETVAVVVSKERTDDYLRSASRDYAEGGRDELGKLVRVRGLIMLGAGVGLQLKVRDVLVERNPNMDYIHLVIGLKDHWAEEALAFGLNDLLPKWVFA
ncbi:hypothetical protein ZIOFF_013227 [Zingiber officinale]|uniref:CST complex subunit STN1 n=1 Tax=Zingiber officinale TaxID=94328 RepID=A0A8J5H9D7_ZINOF|nr:hypothetical protein ZIOFF_013227 [Zingiber officinale]